MQWKIHSKSDESKAFNLTQAELLDALISKHLETNRKDFEILSLELAKFLQYKEAMHETSALQLILIGFTLGYYYKVFHIKNNVEIIDDKSTIMDVHSEDSDEPASS